MAISITSINTGYFYLDGGTLFGVVPRVLWQRQHQPDGQNRIRQALRTFLIRDGQRKIIVDPGIGNWHSRKFIDRYALTDPDFSFDTALADYNLSPSDITDVILTHLHFDHAAGIITQKNHKITFTFNHARIWLQKEHWLWSQNPSPKDQGSFMEPYIQMLSNYPKLELLQGKTQITEHISACPLYGHSPAMQTVTIHSENKTHFLATDLIPDASHLQIPFIMAYDNQPVVTAEEKEKILSQACRENWTIYFYHDPTIEKGRISLKGENFVIAPDQS